MTDAEEIRRLRAIEREIQALLATDDPLTRGQYEHLLGRVRTLLVIKQADLVAGSPETGR